jgi:hypothetical protein
MFVHYNIINHFLNFLALQISILHKGYFYVSINMYVHYYN